MKHRIQNSVYRIQPRHKTSGWRAKRSLEPMWGSWRGNTKVRQERRRMWEKAGKSRRFFPDSGKFSRLFAAFPGFSHLFPLEFIFGQAEKIHRRGAEAPRQRGGESSAELCAKRGHESSRMFGLLRVVTRSYAKVRTDQGRGYAISRIVTGGTLFNHGWTPMNTDEEETWNQYGEVGRERQRRRSGKFGTPVESIPTARWRVAWCRKFSCNFSWIIPVHLLNPHHTL